MLCFTESMLSKIVRTTAILASSESKNLCKTEVLNQCNYFENAITMHCKTATCLCDIILFGMGNSPIDHRQALRISSNSTVIRLVRTTTQHNSLLIYDASVARPENFVSCHLPKGAIQITRDTFWALFWTPTPLCDIFLFLFNDFLKPNLLSTAKWIRMILSFEA
jgi:hypothetical protein